MFASGAYVAQQKNLNIHNECIKTTMKPTKMDAGWSEINVLHHVNVYDAIWSETICNSKMKIA